MSTYQEDYSRGRNFLAGIGSLPSSLLHWIRGVSVCRVPMILYQVCLLLAIMAWACLVMMSRYGFQLDDGILILVEGSVITHPPPSKVGIYLEHFDDGYRLPSSDFLLELLDHHKIHIDQLVPNDVNKIVTLELLCRCNGIVPDIWGSPKNWHNHWLWVDGEKVGRMFLHVKSSFDTAIEFFPEKEDVVRVLRGLEFVVDDFPKYALDGEGMSTPWRLRGKMHDLFVVCQGRQNR
ncbi:unnamed protein product [Lactuca saligna]|uniref:Transposase (putative) gypsy type domain-containing protein n=1 Tax=Lactuca saligna TaxID=75948 RepID=A0AA35ZHU5_LACSI|nr:unnamed protein product [Lactuca saligna]